MFLKKKTAVPLEISGIRVRLSTRARRMSLRIEARSGEIVLVFPPRGSEKNAARFIESNRSWIEKQKAKKSILPRQKIASGTTLSILGQTYIVEHVSGRGLTRIMNGKIIVHGDLAHLQRRLHDFLKSEATRILTAATAEKTAVLGLKMAEVRLRDPKTRWGSCGPDGRIMFSWRLILAPPAVMDYVVAHEVAHRIHMNHSRKFWTLCASLTTKAAESRRWLKTNSHLLMQSV
jgi:hypothetical protein